MAAVDLKKRCVHGTQPITACVHCSRIPSVREAMDKQWQEAQEGRSGGIDKRAKEPYSQDGERDGSDDTTGD